MPHEVWSHGSRIAGLATKPVFRVGRDFNEEAIRMNAATQEILVCCVLSISSSGEC